MHCLWEIIDNAVDEALAGDVRPTSRSILHADGSVEVRDDGRGIPVDVEPKTGLSGVEVVFTKLHAGGKFGGGSYAASGGLHGVGASVVNALSARLDVEVDRGGKTYGDDASAAASPASSPTAGHRPGRRRSRRSSTGPSCDVVGKAKRGVTGTRVRYWADRQIFRKDAELRLRRARRPGPGRPSFLVPGPDARRPRRARPAGHARRATARTRRPSATTAASASSSSSSRPTRRHRRLAAAGRRAPSPRPCRCSTTTGT